MWGFYHQEPHFGIPRSMSLRSYYVCNGFCFFVQDQDHFKAERHNLTVPMLVFALQTLPYTWLFYCKWKCFGTHNRVSSFTPEPVRCGRRLRQRKPQFGVGRLKLDIVHQETSLSPWHCANRAFGCCSQMG